jgi:hypothetical protein
MTHLADLPVPARGVLARRVALAATVGVVSTAAFAVPVATAGAPTPKSKTIIPAKSIGGITIGTTYADLQRLWGTDNTCGAEDAAAAANGAPIDRTRGTVICTWRVKPGEVPDLSGQATVFASDGKVFRIQISGAISAKGVPNSSGPMGKFKTQRGKLTFGSQLKKVITSYPKAVVTGSGYEITTGGRTMVFASSSGRIYSITLKPKGAA